MSEAVNLRNRCKASVYMPSVFPWTMVKGPVLDIAKQHFGSNVYTEQEVMADFTDPRCVVVISQDLLTSRIIGYSYAAPLNKYPEEVDYSIPREDNGVQTAYIWGTALDAEYTGNHIVEDIMTVMETELKKKQFKYFERNAKYDNGYSTKIRRSYGSRILFSSSCMDCDHGAQEFFRIEL